MPGIYVHIPFCRKACFYCDFHFTVSFRNKDILIDTISREIDLRMNYLGNEVVDTIYFGGGTPSVLSVEEISFLLSRIHSSYNIAGNPEITIEANPDDLTEDYLYSLIEKTPVNRLSIGIQSFIDKQLVWMNRRHTSSDALKSVKIAKKAGFNNINTDLIYGIPGMSLEQWKDNLKKIMELNVVHISAYHFTIEPDTVFGRRFKKGFIKEADERISYQQFEVLNKVMDEYKYDHYEISNFAKKGYYSKHNLNYWKHGKYIGLGPSAHSFNGETRQWNLKVNSRYIDGINMKDGYFEHELLSVSDKFNEYVMVALRTKWGVDINYIKNSFEPEFTDHFLSSSEKYIASKHLIRKDNIFVLTEKGMFISDHIISQLFI